MELGALIICISEFLKICGTIYIRKVEQAQV
jgi:hypothetical protein